MVRHACLRHSCEGGAAHRPSPRGARVGLAEAGSGGRTFMTAVLLALTASAAWGASDFLGGLKAKTVPLATVLFVSQGVGLTAAAMLLASLGRPLPPPTEGSYSASPRARPSSPGSVCSTWRSPAAPLSPSRR